VRGPLQVGVLDRLGLDVTHHVDADGAQVVLHDESDRAVLESSGYPYTTLVRDLEARSRRGPTGYRTLAEYEADLTALQTAHPTLVRKFSLGNSVEGRPISAVEITAGVGGADDGRPGYAIFGLHHAREWPSGEVAMEFAEDLADAYGTETRVTDLLDAVRVFIVPVVNPDGLVYSQTTEPMWRKNAPSRGVDLNRNYGAGWGGSGASRDPDDETYRGPGPFSEPESQAVHAFSQSHHLMNVQAIHNISGDVLRQPGFDEYGTAAPDEAAMRILGDAMGAAAGYTSRTALAFGEIHGATEDWNYIAQGAFGYTIELGPSSSNDFQGDYATHVTAQYPGVREALMLAGEEAADEFDHAHITGTVAAGRKLTVRRRFLTGTLCTVGCALGPLAQFEDKIETTLEPAAGPFTWHVGPSTRPWVEEDGSLEAWYLVCEDGGGNVLEAQNLVLGRGEPEEVGDPCDGPIEPEREPLPHPGPLGAGAPGSTDDDPPRPPGPGPSPATPPGGGPAAPPRAVPAAVRARLVIARQRVRRSTLRRRRALVVPLRLTTGVLRGVRVSLRRGSRTVASRRLARLSGRTHVRVPLRRIPAAGTYRLVVRGVTAAGAPVSASATVVIRR
jgi:hypothetical protein